MGSSGEENATVIYSFESDGSWTSTTLERTPLRAGSKLMTNGVTKKTVVASEVDGDNDVARPSSAASSVVDEVLATIAETDSGRKVSDEVRDAVDAKIGELEAVGATQTPNALNNPLIFGDYDVSYVSTGKKQIGNPAGGRYRSGLGALLFRTIGIEQNLYEPNLVINRIAFLVFGLVPGEVVLNGTFTAMTQDLADKKAVKLDSASGESKGESGSGAVDAAAEKGYGVDDGMTVRAFFDPPQLTVGGLPTLTFGPKSSVVLSTTYLDERVRLGKGSRGSLFVFTRKTAEQAERDRKRWRVGGLAVTTLLACTIALFVIAVKRFRAGGVTELSVATAVAVVLSFAMAVVMRQGGIVAEDADYDEKYKATAEKLKAAAEKAKVGDNAASVPQVSSSSN